MDYDSVLTGVLSSLVASLIFLMLLFALRPRISISECIARTNHDGRKVYVVKIVNRTWWRLYDIHAEFAHLKFENVTGGQNVYSKPLTMLKSHIWSMNSLFKLRPDPNAEFAILFVCLDDVDALWTDGSLFEFRVMAKHSFSGFSKIHKRRYYKAATSVRSGSFKFGNSLEID